MQIQVGSWWIFVAPGGGSGVPHKVISIAGREIITWSQMLPDEAEIGGWSFYGSVVDFLKQFKPL